MTNKRRPTVNDAMKSGLMATLTGLIGSPVDLIEGGVNSITNDFDHMGMEGQKPTNLNASKRLQDLYYATQDYDPEIIQKHPTLKFVHDFYNISSDLATALGGGLVRSGKEGIDELSKIAKWNEQKYANRANELVNTPRNAFDWDELDRIRAKAAANYKSHDPNHIPYSKNKEFEIVDPNKNYVDSGDYDYKDLEKLSEKLPKMPKSSKAPDTHNEFQSRVDFYSLIHDMEKGRKGTPYELYKPRVVNPNTPSNAKYSLDELNSKFDPDLELQVLKMVDPMYSKIEKIKGMRPKDIKHMQKVYQEKGMTPALRELMDKE